jgi:bifunctional oligoribonuclease and PAP phosphatase NrnA
MLKRIRCRKKTKMINQKKLVEILKTAKNIALISHISPDGDTLGSMLAFKELLDGFEAVEKVDALINGKIPDIYRFLPGIESVKNIENKTLYQKYDIAIAIDCGSPDRMGDALSIFRNAKTTVNIDHHISNNKFGDINLVNPTATAVGQIIYNLIEPLKGKLSKSIAINLYTAILTDSGGFKFDNVKPETLIVCSELIRNGADPSDIYKHCYETKPLPMVKLHAKAISNMNLADNERIAYTFVTRKLLEEVGASDEHTDGIAESLRQIDTVKIAIVLKETVKGKTKVSFRSNGVNICEIARYFGGGGHEFAAGCTIDKRPEDSMNELLPLIRKQLRAVRS